MSLPDRRSFAAFALVAAVAVAASACSETSADGAVTPTTRPRTTSTVPTTTTVPAGEVAPLTGLAVPEDANLERPPLVVKIDNARAARPQAGLVEADIVYVEQVEGGVTRLAAVYHSRDATTVGPVRSFRSTDLAIMLPLGRPLFGYAGANAAFRKLLRTQDVIDVGQDAFQDEYRRDPSRGRPPHNTFTSTRALFRHAPERFEPPRSPFEFRAKGEASIGVPVPRVVIDYREATATSVSYEWDAAGAGWRRKQDGATHVDVAKNQVVPANVVVQFVRYDYTRYKDQSGARVPEARLVGSGEAWFLSDGKFARGRWAKQSDAGPTSYTDTLGRPVRLTPGTTWVELVPPGQATVPGVTDESRVRGSGSPALRWE